MSLSEIRQIIDSPILMQPVVVRPRDTGARELVDEQILVLLPDAFQLRCDPQSGESPDARITESQNAPRVPGTRIRYYRQKHGSKRPGWLWAFHM